MRIMFPLLCMFDLYGRRSCASEYTAPLSFLIVAYDLTVLPPTRLFRCNDSY